MGAPIIGPELIYGGTRIAALSDLARFHYPWLLLAANGYGRIDLNYRRVIGRVYADFAAPPSEGAFTDLLREYYNAHLLFTYSCDGALWGQWEIGERYLPRYKTALDDASPAPPADAHLAWRNAYAAVSVLAEPSSDDVLSIVRAVSLTHKLRKKVDAWR